MAINYKNIISIFLLITGLVMFSHSLIPHDHHYDNHIETTHEEHQEKDASGNEPIHCHFLNDIVNNKISTSHQSIVKQITLLFNYIPDLNLDFENTPVLKAIFYNDFYYPDYLTYIDISPTRGSPIS